MTRANFPRVLFAAGCVFLLTAPLYLGKFETSLTSEILIWGLFAMGFDVIFGFTGMLSFGQALFFGVGAYGVALTVEDLGWGFWPALAAGVLISLIFAVVTGYFAVKVTWHYFAIITVIFSLVFYFVAVGWKDFTGGDDGTSFKVPHLLSMGGHTLTLYNRFVHYYFILAVVGASYFMLRLITRSQLGRVFLAIKENADRAGLIGYNPHLYRWIAFIIAGFFCGLAGALYALHMRYVSASFMFWTVSGEAVIYAIVGGTGTLVGPVIGAAIMIMLKDYVSTWFEHYFLLMGLITILLVLLAPQGIVGLLFRRRGELAGEGE
ncbi:MAG: branched-chain amino acid ABC transporter permease [Nitrospinota bacterium]